MLLLFTNISFATSFSRFIRLRLLKDIGLKLFISSTVETLGVLGSAGLASKVSDPACVEADFVYGLIALIIFIVFSSSFITSRVFFLVLENIPSGLPLKLEPILRVLSVFSVLESVLWFKVYIAVV
jgi:hypothetical protein